MITTNHVATVYAFENKFGGYSGAIRNEVTREVVRERFNSLDEARNFVRTKAWELFGEVSFAPMRRRGEYYANVWQMNS